MYARIVRFTGVSNERIDEILAEIDSEGPPPGVESAGMQFSVDRDQGTAIFTALFDTAEKMQAADAVFDGMDSSDTPGSRASVDRCEIVADRRM